MKSHNVETLLLNRITYLLSYTVLTSVFKLFLCKFYSLKSWVSLSQFLSMIFSFSDGLVILSYIWESWWRQIAWQPEGQYDAIRKQDSSEDMVNNSSNFLRGCLHEKTRTGASFIPGCLFDFVSHLHDDWAISYLVS